MDVEDVARKGLAPGRAPQQQGKLAIGAGVMGEIVVDDQHVAARFHEMLGDAGRGVGGDVGETGRVVAFGDDDDRVVQRALVAEVGDGLGHRGRALADGAIDAHDIAAVLVEDGVDRDGRLARLPIAQDQFALATADRNERIDGDQAGLQRHGHGRAVHDGRGGALDGQAIACSQPAPFIERPAQRVDDTAQQPFAHGHIHDPARALDLIARLQVPVVAEQHDADFVLVDIERDAEHAAGKFEQLLGARAGQPGDPGNAGRHVGDRADLMRRQLRRKGGPRPADPGERAVEDTLQVFGSDAHGLSCAGLVAALGAALASGLAFSFRRSPTAISRDER